jgi:muconate cycloisomerase
MGSGDSSVKVGIIDSHAAPAQKLTIESVEIIPLDIVPQLKRKMSTGAFIYGDKGSWAGRPVLVGIHAQGLSGWGEIRPVNPFVGETASSIFSSVRDFYAPLLIGRDAMEIQSLLNDCERRLPNNPASIGVLDMALHDLVGRALGVPVFTLLGGACKTEIELEWSVGLNDEASMISEAVAAVEKYETKYLCIKVGPVERADTDYKVAKAIQAEVGSKIQFGVDANTAYDAATAIRLANRLSDAGLAYFEQPVPRTRLGDMKLIRERIEAPVVADESVVTLQDAIEIASLGAADVLALKFYKCGGFRRCRDIAIVAQAAGLNANCAGTANGSYIEAIAAAHLSASIPNHAFGSEFVMGLPSVNEDAIVKNRPIDIKNGVCNLPPGPGMGFELDRRAVANCALTRLIVDREGSRSLVAEPG